MAGQTIGDALIQHSTFNTEHSTFAHPGEVVPQ
jgi:hypothetical protein